MEDFKRRYSDYPVNWSYSTTSIDVTPAGTSKASGVSAISAEFGISMADTIAVGDSNGDLSMLNAAGLACCPSNASAEIKQVSDLDYLHGTLDILRQILAQD